MALNKADTRQRAYRKLDTSEPGGHWIEEAAFNGKVLVGNWQEERTLGEGLQTTVLQNSRGERADWGTIREGGKRVDLSPTRLSSPFLTDPLQGLRSNTWESEVQGSFQGKQNPGPGVGARTKAINEEMLRATEQVLQQTQLSEPSHWETESMAASKWVPVKYPKPRAYVGAVDSYLKRPALTTYNTPAGLRPDNTMSQPSVDNPFKRNTNFTTPISEFKKSPTPIY
eukprot:GGOE01006238.1.p1 GENE.GGOE01006238.1~~GGOE01006238.1.p1  ORF type:complete len:227 (-),score=60.62 GGOE01006238.1:246-926(-)